MRALILIIPSAPYYLKRFGRFRTRLFKGAKHLGAGSIRYALQPLHVTLSVGREGPLLTRSP